MTSWTKKPRRLMMNLSVTWCLYHSRSSSLCTKNQMCLVLGLTTHGGVRSLCEVVLFEVVSNCELEGLSFLRRGTRTSTRALRGVQSEETIWFSERKKALGASFMRTCMMGLRQWLLLPFQIFEENVSNRLAASTEKAFCAVFGEHGLRTRLSLFPWYF